MTEESSGDDERGGDDAAEEGTDRGSGRGPPTERDLEAAREELAAVDADGSDDSETDDSETDTGTDDGDAADGDDAADSDGGGAADDDGDADGGAGPEDGGAGSDDGGAGSDDGGAGSDDGEDVHAEDLVESPAERAVADAETAGDGVARAAESTEAGAAADADGEDAASAGPDAPGGEPSESGADSTAAGARSDAEAVQSDADGSTSERADGESDPGDGQSEADDVDSESDDAQSEPDGTQTAHQPGVPEDVRKYDRFKKVDGAQYDRVNEFLRDRTYVTAREWAIARLCSDFRTETGVEMTKIGENLPELVPFMTDTYTPQAVNQARASFEDKVRTAGATFLYGAMCDFFTAEELDDVMYEATEVAKFLLEVEGVELSVEEELEAEDRISAVMREVRESSAELRHEACPECGYRLTGEE